MIVVDPGHVKSCTTLTAGEHTHISLAKLPSEALARYGRMVNKLKGLADGMKGSGQEPEVVARAYLRALTDPKPKSFYMIGANAKFFRYTARWAPQRLLDMMVASMSSRTRS